MIFRYKTTISEKHAKSVDSTLAKCIENTMILNIDDYHNIHTKHMLNITITSTAIYLVIILMNPIMMQPAILKINIYNSILVNIELIKTNMENKFIKLYGLLYN